MKPFLLHRVSDITSVRCARCRSLFVFPAVAELSHLMNARTILAGILIGWISAAAIAAVAIAVVVWSGLYDVAASTLHPNPVHWVIHTTMIRSVQARAGNSVPARYSKLAMEHGFRIYDKHCVMCHGAPGVPRAPWTAGLNPNPPYLIDAARRWSPSDLKFIVSNGIKMTAMPAWEFSLSKSDLADLVAFLEALPNVSATRYAALRRQNSASRHAVFATQAVNRP